MSETRTCDCGSGATVLSVIRDGWGIFMFTCCKECYQRKLKRFRTDIHTKYEADEPINSDE